MLSSLASIATLMLSTLMMMAGFGLMSYMLPIRSLSEGWSTFIISVIATGYTFGFTVSCVVTPIFVRRVGHVRVFGALITLLTVSILLCALVVEWWAWMIFRGLSGFAIAGDDKYGDFALNRALLKADATRGALKRMFLHAHQITFTHPESGKNITLNAPLAAECERFLVSLGKPLANVAR